MSDFQTVFFVYQIKGFRVLLSKNFLKKINLRVCFLPLKIAFFEGFENDNILNHTRLQKVEYLLKKKPGSLKNLKLKLIRYKLTTKKNFKKIRARTCVYKT